MKKYFYTEKDITIYAKEASKTVVIRSYNNGNSDDKRRKSTKTESIQIQKME